MEHAIARINISAVRALSNTLTLKITYRTFDGKLTTLKTQHARAYGSVLKDA
jgi:hypothetical protein